MRTIRNNSAIKVLQYALYVCLSPLLAAQEISLPSPPDAAQTVSPTPNTLTASNTTFVYKFAQVSLRLEQSVSSASTHKGDRIRFTLVKNLAVDGKLVVPAGTSFYATVSHVRPKNRHRSGDLKFSDADLDLGNGQRVRLTENRHDKFDPGVIPVVILGAVTLVPITVALLPIQLPYLLIHDIREHQDGGAARATKPPPVDQVFSEGEVFTYYADHDTLAHQKPLTISSPSASDPDGSTSGQTE
jgi:hypothetical protein